MVPVDPSGLVHVRAIGDRDLRPTTTGACRVGPSGRKRVRALQKRFFVTMIHDIFLRILGLSMAGVALKTLSA